MVKKYLVCIISIICVFTLSVSVFAQPYTNTAADETLQEQMPVEGGMGGRMGRRQDGMGGGQPPENMTPPENSEDMQRPADAPAMAEMPQEGESSNNTEMQMPDKGNRGNMMPGDGNFGNENQNVDTENEQSLSSVIGFVNEYQTPIISVILLLFAFVFVKLYKRKNY